MPLVEVVELVPAYRLDPLHFVGIGGAGMSGIAAAYAELGLQVSGSDQSDAPALHQLAELGIRTSVGHEAAQVGEARTVVVSSAVRADNPEVAEAERRGLRIWHRSAALGALMLNRRGIVVSGTHGKTSTSGMVASMLQGLGSDPGYVIGAPLATTGRSSSLGTGPDFVVEADESDGSFLQYPAEVVVVTNVEADHLDNWGSVESYVAGFQQLVTEVPQVVLAESDPQTPMLAQVARSHGATVWTVGESAAADVQLREVIVTANRTSARLVAVDDEGPVELAVPGRYNLHNAAAAYAAGRALGYDGGELRAGLATFRGADRRFQLVGEENGIRIYDDYAHHPTELTALLAAAREQVPTRGRLVVAFQPHLFSRTESFAVEFVHALRGADRVLVCGIYPAREFQEDFPGVTARILQEGLHSQGREADYAESLDDAAAALASWVLPGDVVLTVGAGDITQLGPDLLARLRGRR
ncbi:MAG: UDP-N-acetylmuramate--L-alanine ligase [Propioniciclava sp.]